MKTQYTKFATGISSLDFNHDGSKLAVAASYTMEEGPKAYVQQKLAPSPPFPCHARFHPKL